MIGFIKKFYADDSGVTSVEYALLAAAAAAMLTTAGGAFYTKVGSAFSAIDFTSTTTPGSSGSSL